MMGHLCPFLWKLCWTLFDNKQKFHIPGPYMIMVCLMVLYVMFNLGNVPPLNFDLKLKCLVNMLGPPVALVSYGLHDKFTSPMPGQANCFWARFLKNIHTSLTLKETRAILLRRALWLGCIFPHFCSMCTKITVYETLPQSIKQLKIGFTDCKI